MAEYRKRSKHGKEYYGVKVKLDPSPAQERKLNSHAGAARFAYNWALDAIKSQIDAKAGLVTDAYGLRKAFNSAKDEVAPWWKANSKEAYNSGFEAVASAYKNWDESKKGVRKGPRMGFPAFKCKGRDKESFAYTTGSFGVADAHGVKCPCIGRVHTLENVGKRVHGKHVTRMTISRETDGWYASLQVECDPVKVEPKAKAAPVGADIGMRKALVLSDGTVYANPKTLEANLARLRRLDKKMARQRCENPEYWKSKRYQKTKAERARLYKRIHRLREQFWASVIADMCKRYSHIYIEDLNVKGMLAGKDKRGRKRRRNMQDMAFGMFRRMLGQMAPRRGVAVHAVNRYFASSKTCSGCGSINDGLGSSETFSCPECGLVMDRDSNAAVNILERGLAECPPDVNRRGGDVRHAVGNGVRFPHLAA